ncbi:MAG: DMT family transporter [Anaerovoracaceae bacterium]|jgi:drug/metabolite transporter (DMT)-like permease
MKNLQGYILPIITFVLWGSLYVISKTAMEEVPPITLLALRYLIAIAVLYIIAKKRVGRLPAIKKEHWPLFFAIGVLGYGLAIICQQISTDMLDASLAALLNSLNPIFVFILAFFILKEKITAAKVTGMLMAIGGVYIIFGSSGGGISIMGILLSLVSVFFWSLCAVLVRKISQHYDPIVLTMYGIIISMVLLVPATIAELQYKPCTFSPAGVLCILYLGIVATAFAHALWNRGLAAAPASTCSLFYPVQPLTSAILGIAVLQEQLTHSFIIGAAIISAGIIMTVISDRLSLPGFMTKKK